jgi:hypothetical protein
MRTSGAGQAGGGGGARMQRRKAATSFCPMREYQAVMLRLTKHERDDEEALTDLLNERSRGGWELATLAQDGLRMTVVFQRAAESDA